MKSSNNQLDSGRNEQGQRVLPSQEVTDVCNLSSSRTRGANDSEEYMMGKGANDRWWYVQVGGIFNVIVEKKQAVEFQIVETLEDS